MRTELLGQEQNVVRVKVEFEAAEFTAKLEEVFRDITHNTNIPGFRKGHTPRKILEMRFGRDNLRKEALEKMLPDALREITADYELDIMDTPTLKIDDIHEGQPVTCELVIEVRPEVELPELEDIEVERLRQKVPDGAVDEAVENFRKQFAALNPLERPAGEGDVVSASFVTRVFTPGETEPEPAAGEPAPSDIDLSDSAVRPEVKAALLGKSKGDEASAEFDIEDGYRDASLAGKRIRYDITVNSVNEKVLPEVGPELFKKVFERGADAEIQTENEFREEIKKEILEHQESEEADRVSDAAIGAVVAASRLEVPDSLLGRQAAFVKERDAEGVRRRFNISMEEYLSKSSISPAQYEQTIREQAEATLRRTLVLDEIGDKFDVEIKKEDIEAEISRLSAMYGMERAKVRSHYYKSEANMSQLSDGLRYDRVTKLIMDKIKIKEVDELTPSAESTQGAENAADAAASAE